VWQIWAGQYAGIAVLVMVSAVAALGLTIVPDRWVGLLGLVPLALGVRGLVGAVRVHPAGPVPVRRPRGVGLLPVAGVTIANGADNISVYTPLFRTASLDDGVLTVAVFAVLVAVWCLAGSWLGSHHAVVALLQRFGHWMVPAVFVAIGVVIVIQSGVVPRVVRLL
jgi:cadmium resistance protein CadD (predicted permease)